MKHREMTRRVWGLWGMKILTAPLLLWQGRRVRKRTPVLPEPVSRTSGTCGQGTDLRILLIGDSSAAGVGATCADESLLHQLIKGLQQDHRVHFRQLAKTGQTTAGMLNELQASEALGCDVVISALGVNDVTSQVPVRRWLEQQAELIAILRNKFSARLTILSGLPPMGEFPALSWPLNAYLGACADLLDDGLAELCDSHPQVVFHSLRNYPESATAASDGFHPGPEVYRQWAASLTGIINDNHAMLQE